MDVQQTWKTDRDMRRREVPSGMKIREPEESEFKYWFSLGQRRCQTLTQEDFDTSDAR